LRPVDGCLAPANAAKSLIYIERPVLTQALPACTSISNDFNLSQKQPL
jgi:hypothetical protein